MGNIPYSHCVKFYPNLMRTNGALGFFQRASPPIYQQQQQQQQED